MNDPVWSDFATAVEAGDDAATETAVARLIAAHEPLLIGWANDEQASFAERRWWAVRALAAVGGAESAPVLAVALSAPDAALRAAAALALGHLCPRAPDAVAAQLTRLADLLEDDDGFVRGAAVDGLSLCGELSLPALKAVLLHGSHEGARTRAASALRNLRSLRAAPLLFRYLNDHNHLVHTYCYEALDDLGLLDNVLLMP